MPSPEGQPILPPPAEMTEGIQPWEAHQDVIRQETMNSGNVFEAPTEGQMAPRKVSEELRAMADEARASVEDIHGNSAETNPYDTLMDPNSDLSASTVESAAVRPNNYPIVSEAEQARREANVSAAVRQGRVADGKTPFVMPN